MKKFEDLRSLRSMLIVIGLFAVPIAAASCERWKLAGADTSSSAVEGEIESGELEDAGMEEGDPPDAGEEDPPAEMEEPPPSCGFDEEGICQIGPCPEGQVCALKGVGSEITCECTENRSCGDTHPACDGSCPLDEDGRAQTCLPYTGASDGCTCVPTPPPDAGVPDAGDFCAGKSTGCYPGPTITSGGQYCYGLGINDCASPCVWCP